MWQRCGHSDGKKKAIIWTKTASLWKGRLSHVETRIENFYFYNCEQIDLQNWFHSKNGVIFHLSQSRAKKAVILHLVSYRLFAALLLKAHHQKTSSSCLSSPASNMLCGATLNKGWWNDKKKWSVFNHPLWKWTGMRSTPGWSDTERERRESQMKDLLNGLLTIWIHCRSWMQGVGWGGVGDLHILLWKQWHDGNKSARGEVGRRERDRTRNGSGEVRCD